MKAAAIKRYRCSCEECDPLPPIEGLHPLTYEREAEVAAERPKGLLGIIAERVMSSRRQG
ncbi:hypothetical protein PYR71_11295 [Rhizobium sp. MC63]|uniref:Uncharacterized protein n=1 Tax=Rhizobium mulingense TaxID=3031128 RepID=A0ACC6MU97_9HYPH|nr:MULTISPECIES: hypothetical protein [unclassified Rhizobium]MDF0697086.1 hypothetical protein [Rhizobium sp. MC63]MEA3516752.1 hypothetical protein [Rhizobium sp. MJ31]MEB3042445.1 hypothetical protein [Rhizobium sp. MJ21]